MREGQERRRRRGRKRKKGRTNLDSFVDVSISLPSPIDGRDFNCSFLLRLNPFQLVHDELETRGSDALTQCFLLPFLNNGLIIHLCLPIGFQSDASAKTLQSKFGKKERRFTIVHVTNIERMREAFFFEPTKGETEAK
jgi:hypothetical protein